MPLLKSELLLWKDLRRIVPLSWATLWRMERVGRFPRRIPISEKRIAWRRREIEAWLASREAERDSAVA